MLTRIARRPDSWANAATVKPPRIPATAPQRTLVRKFTAESHPNSTNASWHPRTAVPTEAAGQPRSDTTIAGQSGGGGEAARKGLR